MFILADAACFSSSLFVSLIYLEHSVFNKEYSLSDVSIRVNSSPSFTTSSCITTLSVLSELLYIIALIVNDTLKIATHIMFDTILLLFFICIPQIRCCHFLIKYIARILIVSSNIRNRKLLNSMLNNFSCC